MIRKATPADFYSISLLVKSVGNMHHEARPDIFKAPAFSEEIYMELLNNECVEIFVYEESINTTENEILGFCHMSFFDYGENQTVYRDVVVAHIDSMGVVEKAQRRGIGRALLEYARERAKLSGAERLQLSVCPFNENASKMYENMGFKVMHTTMERKL
ncbi:MAG: GNAT family N-acetyltransferase [Defluviitaleaceae bacterium]|nr:GNAT family N-acetyltransferase [Defluviitaleaceae bacterium]